VELAGAEEEAVDELDLRVVAEAEEEAAIAEPVPSLCASLPHSAPLSPAATAPPHIEPPPALAAAPLHPLPPFAGPLPRRTPYQPTPSPGATARSTVEENEREREEWRGEQADRGGRVKR
jgi:hypothetical protein